MQCTTRSKAGVEVENLGKKEAKNTITLKVLISQSESSVDVLFT